jgi:hypothetical protein
MNSQFKECGIETKYAKSIKKDGTKTLEYNFVRFGLKSIGTLEYQVYKINSLIIIYSVTGHNQTKPEGIIPLNRS